MKKLLVVLASSLLLLGCVNTSKGNKPRPPLKVMEKAPEFSIKNVRGGEPLSSKDLKGKVVIVDFWATWCVPCKKEIPEYNELYAKLKDAGVEFVGVTFDSGAKIEAVQPFLTELEMKYPVGMGNDAIDVAFGGHPGYPTTFVIGKNWKVYRKLFGSPDEKIPFLEKDIEELLAKSETDD